MKSRSLTKSGRIISVIGGRMSSVFGGRMQTRWVASLVRFLQEGENGSHGIDGFYIKISQNNITDVLVAESKWNTSRLGSTKKDTIKQMSKIWILDKLKEAKPHNPEIKNFDQISIFVKHNTYRARLFKLKPLNADRLKIILYSIKNKSDDKDIEKIDKSEIILDIKYPKNLFHKEMIKVYLGCKMHHN